MKRGWYFLSSFLLVLLVSISFTAVAQEAVQPAGKEKIFSFLKDIDMFNIVLLGIATFAGGAWAYLRNKVRVAGELLLDVYDYTSEGSDGGKKLTRKERQDIIRQALMLLGKAPAAPVSIASKTEETGKPLNKVDENKRFILDRGNK